MTVVDNGPDLTTLASRDKRVARDLAGAERDRLAAAQRIASADAAAERKLRLAEGELAVQGKRDEVKAARRERRLAEREAHRRDLRERKSERRAVRKALVATAVDYVRANAAAVYSACIYGLAVAGAVYGQIDAARLHEIPLLTAIAASAAIEGTGLAMALTAHHQRLSRERALAARALVWFCTGLAVAINYLGHVEENEAKAYILAALSGLGIVVFEIRSGAKHRQQLRALGMIPEPGEQFGLARWVTYPGETFAAWKLGVRDRLSPGAAKLVARVERARAARQARREFAVAERRRLADADVAAKRRRKLAEEIAGRARQAIREAKGDPGASLALLVQLANTGTPAPLLALPSPARADADAARLALADTEARLQAEAEARENAQTVAAQAEAEVAAVRREAEAEVARVRQWAEAEAAAVRRGAEAEVADAHRRAEAEAARRTDAESRAEAAVASFRSESQRRAEAERHAASAQERAEAEARRAAQMHGQAEAAGRGSETVQRQLADEQRQRVDAESRAVTAERLLAAEQQRIARIEQQHEQAVAQVADLRIQLAEAQAGSRRSRRSTPAAPAEQVLFHGRPVPVVQGAGPETVLKVLTAFEATPDATQKALADEVDTSIRTVRAVLKAANEQVNADNEKEEAAA